jgi:hypothetical protein
VDTLYICEAQIYTRKRFPELLWIIHCCIRNILFLRSHLVDCNIFHTTKQVLHFSSQRWVPYLLNCLYDSRFSRRWLWRVLPSGVFQQTTRCYIPGERTLHSTAVLLLFPCYRFKILSFASFFIFLQHWSNIRASNTCNSMEISSETMYRRMEHWLPWQRDRNMIPRCDKLLSLREEQVTNST